MGGNWQLFLATPTQRPACFRKGAAHTFPVCALSLLVKGRMKQTQQHNTTTISLKLKTREQRATMKESKFDPLRMAEILRKVKPKN